MNGTQTTNAQAVLKNKFWNANYKYVEKVNKQNGETEVKQVLTKLTIDQLQFCEFLYSYGFRRFDIEGDSIFIRIIDNRIVNPVTVTEIADFVYSWIDSLPKDVDGEGLDRNKIKSKILGGVSFYFNKQRLYYLKPREKINFNRDTIDTSFIYYKNGFCRITRDGVKFELYNNLKGYIWSSQVLDREFYPNRPITGRNVTKDFLRLVSGNRQSRLNDLQISIGYLIHDFTDYKMQLLLLTDSGNGEDEDSNGRSGKTLFCRLVGFTISPNPMDPRYKTYVEVNAKDFDSRDKHKYDQAGIETKLIVLNDLRKYFDPDCVYNDITEGQNVNKKNMQPFKIRAKMIGTTNKSIMLQGRSSRDRFLEFEFSEYFNDQHVPEDEFKHWFFRDWTEKHWNDYAIVMHECIQMFLANGAKLNEPEQINLNVRKLREHTAPEFLEFVNDVAKLQTNTKYLKNKLYSDFREQFSDFQNPKFTQRRFTAWIKAYCNLSGTVDPYNKTTHEHRTSAGSFYIFYRKDGTITNI